MEGIQGAEEGALGDGGVGAEVVDLEFGDVELRKGFLDGATDHGGVVALVVV